MSLPPQEPALVASQALVEAWYQALLAWFALHDDHVGGVLT